MIPVQGDVLDLVANDHRADEDYEKFLWACRKAAHRRETVSINDVRLWLSNTYGLTINPRRYSSFWRRARLDGHLERTGEWETNTDAKGRNSGKPQPCYRWTGGAA